jgi:hypothetical protein
MAVGRYSTRPVGTTGHEILVDGEVVAWSCDRYWALRILALLVKAEKDESGETTNRPAVLASQKPERERNEQGTQSS